jgi:hypothetical protein
MAYERVDRMKAAPLMLVAVMAMAASAHSQEEDATTPGDSTVAPVAPTATARIIGNIPDGTPPPPQPPKPKYIVPTKDILATTTQQQGGRTITLNRIQPIALPPPPEPAPPSDGFDNAALRERLAENRAEQPKTDLILLSATIYRSQNGPPRSLVRYWAGGKGGQIAFWSSADFALISGIHCFSDSAATMHGLIMAWGYVDTSLMAARFAARGREYHAPDIPAFPDGPATFAIVGEQPADEILVSIQSLHDLYNSEYARLKTAMEGRERARIEREAYLKANPPQPKDITLNYWRVEKPAPVKGANK